MLRRYTVGITGLGLIIVVVTSVSLLIAQEVMAKRNIVVVCRTGITAGLTGGPHAPLDLSGNVELFVKEDLSFTGVLTLRNGGSKINIKGQGAGRGIDLVFEPTNGKQLFAHGVLENSIWECKGNAGGPLVGPDYGDQGDWTNYPPFIRVISPTVR